MNIGIVISNHGAEPETEAQMKKQFKVDEVRYFKHPDIDPRHSKEHVWHEAREFLLHTVHIHDIQDDVVVAVVNGEYGFSTACVHYLYHEHDIVSAYPTTERGAAEEVLPDGSIKTVHVYKFVQ